MPFKHLSPIQGLFAKSTPLSQAAHFANPTSAYFVGEGVVVVVEVVVLFCSAAIFFGCFLALCSVVLVDSTVEVLVSVLAGAAGSCAPNESAALPIMSERPRAADNIVFILFLLF